MEFLVAIALMSDMMNVPDFPDVVEEVKATTEFVDLNSLDLTNLSEDTDLTNGFYQHFSNQKPHITVDPSALTSELEILPLEKAAEEKMEKVASVNTMESQRTQAQGIMDKMQAEKENGPQLRAAKSEATNMGKNDFRNNLGKSVALLGLGSIGTALVGIGLKYGVKSAQFFNACQIAIGLNFNTLYNVDTQIMNPPTTFYEVVYEEKTQADYLAELSDAQDAIEVSKEDEEEIEGLIDPMEYGGITF